MIQRKQTIFLLLALVATTVCLMLNIGHFEPEGMGVSKLMNNLYVKDVPMSAFNYALFFVLVLTCPITLWAIFAYKNRKFQARLCVVNILLALAWTVLYAIYGFVVGIPGMIFHPEFAACLPLVAIILYILARKGILDDEKLVRAADRIR